jgi:hypothetical protein
MCFSIGWIKLILLLDRYSFYTLVICSQTEISVLKFSPEQIRWIESDIWLRRCIFGYPSCITHCSSVFWCNWMSIVSHQASNSIKGMGNSFLHRLWSFEVMPKICLSGWRMICSVSTRQQVLGSESASERSNWNSSHMRLVLFAAP